LRFGKIANLSPKDVHQDLDGIWFIEVEDKNGELFRTFCFGEVQEIILRWKALAEEKGYDVLIHGPNGGKMRQKYVRPYLMTACRAVGIPWGRGRYQFTFHSTRRAFATYLLNSGVSIERVMEAGNWKSFASVQRYAKLSTASKKDALRSVEKLLSV
jgi:integrase